MSKISVSDNKVTVCYTNTIPPNNGNYNIGTISGSAITWATPVKKSRMEILKIALEKNTKKANYTPRNSHKRKKLEERIMRIEGEILENV
jgi:hypothetical protein